MQRGRLNRPTVDGTPQFLTLVSRQTEDDRVELRSRWRWSQAWDYPHARSISSLSVTIWESFFWGVAYFVLLQRNVPKISRDSKAHFAASPRFCFWCWNYSPGIVCRDDSSPALHSFLCNSASLDKLEQSALGWFSSHPKLSRPLPNWTSWSFHDLTLYFNATYRYWF